MNKLQTSIVNAIQERQSLTTRAVRVYRSALPLEYTVTLYDTPLAVIHYDDLGEVLDARVSLQGVTSPNTLRAVNAVLTALLPGNKVVARGGVVYLSKRQPESGERAMQPFNAGADYLRFEATPLSIRVVRP